MFSYTLTVPRFTFFNLVCTKLGSSRNNVISSNRCERFSGVKMYYLKESKAIFGDNKGKFGIYRFVKLLNGYVYIGSSVYLSQRFRDYFSPFLK
jgi:hypothetical protein